jgi:ubiquinone/menaquinone biosynthesis C-methylase UbiE
MELIAKIKKLLQKSSFIILEKGTVEAYDIWAQSYDNQPGNLMLDLDNKIFEELIENINIQNKVVADIGCGTGRHWRKIYEKKPDLLMGFDVSAGMLNQLRQKFPAAVTHLTTDNLLTTIDDQSVDFLITTLTIAHIKNIDEAISSWSRVLKNDGDLIITDFHPSMLAKGGKRSFTHEGATQSVLNYVHLLDKVKRLFAQHQLTVVRQIEKEVDEEVRGYYESQDALPVYNRFKGLPIIYGLHLKKQRAS